jgi:hypothetical protein
MEFSRVQNITKHKNRNKHFKKLIISFTVEKYIYKKISVSYVLFLLDLLIIFVLLETQWR